MAFFDSVFDRAKAAPGRVAVPECTNPAMMRAACNISSKLLSMFADCTGFGPVYQGFRKPVLDCSRGDAEERIYANFALCSLMAAYQKEQEARKA